MHFIGAGDQPSPIKTHCTPSQIVDSWHHILSRCAFNLWIGTSWTCPHNFTSLNLQYRDIDFSDREKKNRKVCSRSGSWKEVRNFLSHLEHETKKTTLGRLNRDTNPRGRRRCRRQQAEKSEQSHQNQEKDAGTNEIKKSVLFFQNVRAQNFMIFPTLCRKSFTRTGQEQRSMLEMLHFTRGKSMEHGKPVFFKNNDIIELKMVSPKRQLKSKSIKSTRIPSKKLKNEHTSNSSDQKRAKKTCAVTMYTASQESTQTCRRFAGSYSMFEHAIYQSLSLCRTVPDKHLILTEQIRDRWLLCKLWLKKMKTTQGLQWWCRKNTRIHKDDVNMRKEISKCLYT